LLKLNVFPLKLLLLIVTLNFGGVLFGELLLPCDSLIKDFLDRELSLQKDEVVGLHLGVLGLEVVSDVLFAMVVELILQLQVVHFEDLRLEQVRVEHVA
tara:strand:+ start:2649 stop:2945 length:297 start_codon:yes stop_codon:yes gene_type:complete